MALPDPVTRQIVIALESGQGDGVVEVRHPYLERTYLPLIGPSATLCLRRLRELLSGHETASVDLLELAAELGLPKRLARSAPMIRTVNRLIGFRLARWETGRLFVPIAVPLVSEGALERLPASARAYHRLVLRALVAPDGDGDHEPGLGPESFLGVGGCGVSSSSVDRHPARR